MKKITFRTPSHFLAKTLNRQSLLITTVLTIGIGIATLTPGSVAQHTSAIGWNPEQKCTWLRENLPQNTTDLQAFAVKYANSASVDVERIAPTIYVCNSDGDSVFDGFIILGPRDGHHEGEFTITVPPHGAINSYAEACGAKYSEEPTVVAKLPEACDWTYMATGGTVTAVRASVYAWNDFNAPIGQTESIKTMVGASNSSSDNNAGGSSNAATTTDDTCMSVTNLAASSGYQGKFEILEDVQQPEDVTKYGGRVIHVIADGVTVPNGWEAIGPDGVHITSGGKLANGVYVSLYPPAGSCRDSLEVSN